MKTPSTTAFAAGVKSTAPILLGMFPFAAISGIAAVESGLTIPLAFGLSVIVFAGAAQLATVQLIAAGTNPLVILLTALIINLRFVMYSVSLTPHLKHLPAKMRAGLAYIMTDQAYAISIMQFNREPQFPHKGWYFLGSASSLWLIWQIGTAVGVFLGAQVPESWGLDFAIPLTFIALTAPNIKDRSSWTAAACAGLVAVLGKGLPYNLGLITATFAGVLAGVEAARRWPTVKEIL